MKKIYFFVIILLNWVHVFAYDFSAVCSTGQTLYYNITSDYTIAVTYPQAINVDGSITYYHNYTKPAGRLDIPETVSYNGVIYSVTSIGDHAFYGCSDIDSIIIEQNVTSIGSDAFSGCTGVVFLFCNASMSLQFTYRTANYYGYSYSSYFPFLRQLIIGNNVQHISDYAFYGCHDLDTLIIGSGVTGIGQYAFHHCPITYMLYNAKNCTTSLSYGYDIHINPGGGQYYTYAAPFDDAVKNRLHYLIIGDSVNSIPSKAFYECSNIFSVVIGKNVTTISADAFYGCTGVRNLFYNARNCTSSLSSAHIPNLQQLTIGNCVQSIPTNAFNSFSQLDGILIIPDNVISIGSGAFQNCSQLDSLVIGQGITTIEDATFYGCSNLNGTLIIPDNITSVGNEALKNCSQLDSLAIGQGITTIGNGSFSGCSQLSGLLVIPNNVTFIGSNAFTNCINIDSIVIGHNVSIIGPQAFSGCTSVTNLYYYARNCTKGFGYIEGETCYQSLPNLQHLIIGDSVQSIPDYTFYNCSQIEGGLIFSKNITSIGSKAFFNCNNINSLNIDSAFVFIGSNAFTSCDNITSLNFNDITIFIGDSSFLDCDQLVNINLGNSAVQIGNSSFADCDNIITIDFDNTSVTIGDGAFMGCDRLVNVNLGDSAISIGNSAFKDCFRLNSVQMGNSVTHIGNSAFEGCVRLPFPKLSNALTTIGDSAFKGCNLFSGEITIPAEVDSIGDYAFSGCSGVTSLNMKPLNPPIIFVHTFDSISINIPVYVPCGRVLNYYVTNYWENFPNILEAQPFEVEVSSNNNAMGTATVTSAPTCSNHEAIIAATANEGFHFHSWNDGNQLNPRVIAVEQDTSFTAIFAVNQINAVINSSDISMGTATGSGVYSYNSVITATAIPNNNYHFLRWSDGNTQNPRYIPATEDITLTAIFVSNVSTITVASNNSDMGTAIGSGLYFYQQQISIMANPNYGYHFVAWNDGNTQNPRQLIVNCDTSFVATFAPNIYAVSINSLNNVMGYTSGSGNYTYNSQMSFSATANYGYHFTQWNDGVSQNPRTLTVTQDTSFTAQFAANSYAVTVTANDPVMGSAFGAGSFTYNTQTVISATANYGYHFVQWSDGVTDNPRMITVTNSAEYEAQFAINFYTITVGSNNPAIGTASGGGTYNYNSIINLVATPNYGYHFTQWSDGNTDNPRTITVIQNGTYTAQFAINSYAVTVAGNDPAMGTVSGTGSYIYNNTATISASPYYGYHFTQWNDGNTDNPRTFVVTQDVTYTAQFDFNTYTISTYSNDITIGYVTGGGTYNYNSIVALTAVPSEHYHFVQWNDSISDNPRNIIVKKDSVYTAYFAIDQHQILVNSANTMMGTAEGSGLYNYGSNVYISAIPNYGYHFTQWSDGNTQNPRHVSVSCDTAFTALFEINNYTLTVLNGDTTMGSVSNSGTYNYLTQVTISATPVYGYHFVQWTDGNTDNPRTVTLTQDTVFTAQFAINTYFVNLTVNDSTLGSVSGSGEYAYLTQVVISATANENCHFVQWSDGSTSNPRQITLTNDMTLTAQFAENEKFLVQVVSSNSVMGTTEGSGEYYVGIQISISAIPYEHYHFVQWSDGVTSNPRTITVIENVTYTAIFEPNNYTITAISSNETMGGVTGGGSYSYGTIVELRATANDGYHFVCWNVGDSSSIRSIIVEGDAEYTAIFSEGVSVANHLTEKISVYPNPTYGQVYVSTEDVVRVEVYDMYGQLLKCREHDNNIDLSDLADGVYVLRVYTSVGVCEKKVVKGR